MTVPIGTYTFADNLDLNCTYCDNQVISGTEG